MTIRLVFDPATGKRNIVVGLRRDEDLLPHEHEQRHRQLIEALIGQGLLTAEEAGQVIVEREQPTSNGAAPDRSSTENERAQQAEGGR